MGISFSASEAQLKHLNIRKEGNEEDAITAIDLKIECETEAGVLIPLLGADRAPIFWHDNADEDVLYTGISEIKTWGVFEDHELHFCGLRFPIVKLKNFSFKPAAKRSVELTFSASIRSPSDQQINVLAEMLHAGSGLNVVAPPDLFDDMPTNTIEFSAKEEQVSLPLECDDDVLYPEAVCYVRESGRASASAIQRKLRIGYNRAAILLEKMELSGVITPADYAGRREVLQ